MVQFMQLKIFARSPAGSTLSRPAAEPLSAYTALASGLLFRTFPTLTSRPDINPASSVKPCLVPMPLMSFLLKALPHLTSLPLT